MTDSVLISRRHFSIPWTGRMAPRRTRSGNLRFSARTTWLKLASELNWATLVPGSASSIALYRATEQRLAVWSWYSHIWFSDRSLDLSEMRCLYAYACRPCCAIRHCRKRAREDSSAVCDVHICPQNGSILNILSQLALCRKMSTAVDTVTWSASVDNWKVNQSAIQAAPTGSLVSVDPTRTHHCGTCSCSLIHGRHDASIATSMSDRAEREILSDSVKNLCLQVRTVLHGLCMHQAIAFGLWISSAPSRCHTDPHKPVTVAEGIPFCGYQRTGSARPEVPRGLVRQVCTPPLARARNASAAGLRMVRITCADSDLDI